MSLEGTIGREALVLLKRNPKKYAPNVSGLYLLSLKDYGRGKAARAGYFFFRNIDDVLDGDREVDEDPVGYALRYREHIAEGTCDRSDPVSYTHLDVYKRQLLREGKALAPFLLKQRDIEYREGMPRPEFSLYAIEFHPYQEVELQIHYTQTSQA